MKLDGRGHWRRWSKKELVTDRLQLPIRAVLRYLAPDQPAGILFTWRQNGEEIGSVSIANVPNDCMVLAYTYCGEQITEVIRWSSTVPRFGGQRYWWRCPGCLRRCGILYGPSFRCRQCHRLTYKSTQSGCLADSLDSKLLRLRERLGAPCDVSRLMEPVPPKPRNMRWESYFALSLEYLRLTRLLFGALHIELLKIAGPPSGGIPTTRAAHAEQERLLRREAQRRVSLWDSLPPLPLLPPPPDPPTQPPGRQGPARLTLGQLARAAAVRLDFAREAEVEGLLRPDAGRTGRRKRYRAKLASWLGKLHALRDAGYDWSEVRAWTERRFKPGHEAEARWPAGYESGSGQKAASS